ncbi:PREDICTED: F-box protein At5g07610 [Tarenaya hassleriana]|uniref:F-box protein At5g07610 n=1 Tax=Tarenaya hassleriana TaxID=28532 RepID=UPI00053C1865|nr:PREDICTED: F-box protein At5g07610 [Tarenaya hassleriana]XP_010545553.1 PREDICTED: F-box protein At5g07610 [Tarenaya hassleriana]
MVETRAMRAHRILGEKWNQIESTKDVFVDILSRFSAESLQSYKSVSKYWHKSISNKEFTNMQLSRSQETPFYIACLQLDTDMVLYLMKPRETVSHQFVTIPGSSKGGNLNMVCSFNGLICCINDPAEDEEDVLLRDLEIRICNPATGDSLLLPQGTPSLDKDPSIGVGYGPDISDYKVFRIFCVGMKEPGEYHELEEGDEVDLDGSSEMYLYECEVYSSSTGSWRGIGQVPRIPMRIFSSTHVSTHVFVGGKIYWLVASKYSDTPGCVLCTDMEGNFKLFRLPDYGVTYHEEEGISPHTFLINLKGSLCLVVVHLQDLAVWILKEEDGEPDWELEHDIIHCFEVEDVIRAATSCGDTLLFVTQDHWYRYDFGLKTWKMESPCVEFFIPIAFPYTESLLPCNGGVDPGRM